MVTVTSTYPTSFESIEIITKQGDTVIEGVISPDGFLFANPNKNSTDIYLWNRTSGTFYYSSKLDGHVAEVESVDINSDHSIIVSGSVDETAIIWAYNATSGTYDLLQQLDDVESSVPIVQVSNNGSVVAVGSGS
ncbi:unnamed protein product [Sphagnum balticum]